MIVKIVQAKDVIPEGIHPVCQNIKFMPTDAKHYTGAYNNNYKLIASESFEYALMASNVYEKYDSSNPEFKIPGWNQEGDKKTNWKGFGAHVYKSTTGPKTKFVIAFEGTDPTSIADWIFGNLNIYWKGQYADAARLVDKIADENRDAEIITTGHSLGGGLAIHAALHRSHVTAYAFNSSPRIFSPDSLLYNGSKIVLISENDDVLGVLRKHWGTMNKEKVSGPYDKFDFLNLASNNNNKVVEHGMYAIARGLMLIAANYQNEKALLLISQLARAKKSCPDGIFRVQSDS
jgi:hypothetical protein